MKSSIRKPSALHSRRSRSRLIDRLARCHAVVIGGGTLGRAVAVLLASLGIKYMSIFDPAYVTKKDLARGFMEDDLRLAKVDAVANIAHQHNPRMELQGHRCRFRRAHLQKWKLCLKNAVFLCLKTTAESKSVSNFLSKSVEFLCDGKAKRAIIRLAVFMASGNNKYYASTLVPNALGIDTNELIVANTTACLMVGQFIRWLHQKRSHVEQMDITLVLQANQ